jgi:beta-fructofuranosidase
MTFVHDDHWVWDFWVADDGERFHLYYLHAPRSLGDPDLRHRNARIGHASSLDLRTWHDHGPVLGPGAPDDFDGSATWTGSVVRGDDGLWRMFYTGARFLDADSGANIETIGVATSADLHTWVKSTGPIVVADPTWYETLDAGTWREEAWRDPWVFRSADGWHMLVTARSVDGDLVDRGVIGLATSPDLATWTVQPPVSRPGAGFMHLEVPQHLEIDGRALLLFSCDTAHLTGSRAARGERGGIWVAGAPGAGGYPVADATRLLDERHYSGRVVRDRAGAWVLLAFENVGNDGEFIGRLSDPLPLAWSGETLVVEVEREAAR